MHEEYDEYGNSKHKGLYNKNKKRKCPYCKMTIQGNYKKGDRCPCCHNKLRT